MENLSLVHRYSQILNGIRSGPLIKSYRDETRHCADTLDRAWFLSYIEQILT